MGVVLSIKPILKKLAAMVIRSKELLECRYYNEVDLKILNQVRVNVAFCQKYVRVSIKKIDSSVLSANDYSQVKTATIEVVNVIRDKHIPEVRYSLAVTCPNETHQRQLVEF